MSARSRRWVREHRSDPWVKQAQAKGYRSRAAFKLIEIDDAQPLLVRGAAVVDLGAAPGGWSQVAAERVRGGAVVAVDRLPLDPIPGVTIVAGDAADEEVLERVRDALAARSCDLLLSDMAPDLSGIGAADEARCAALAETVVEVADRLLRRGGSVLAKTFAGAVGEQFRALLAQRFARVTVRKPRASRARSSEHYLLARGYGGRDR